MSLVYLDTQLPVRQSELPATPSRLRPALAIAILGGVSAALAVVALTWPLLFLLLIAGGLGVAWVFGGAARIGEQ